MKKRRIKKWYNYHSKYCDELTNRYKDYCHKRLYQYFPYMTDCALRLKKLGFNLLDHPKLTKYLNL